MQQVFRVIAASLVLVLVNLVSFNAQSAPLLTLELTDTTLSGAGGDSLVFTGVITNRTGVSLDSTDLFFSFSGYDPDLLVPAQLLGFTPFTLPHLTFSAEVDLFSIDIAAAALPGSYDLQLLLQDVNGNLADVAAITVNITGNGPPQGLPEAPSLALVMLAGWIAGAARRRSRLSAGAQRHAAA